MGIVYMFKCDGCGEEKQMMGADSTELPEKWQAFSLNSSIIHACSVKCGVLAVERKLLKMFVR